jgi:ribonuclease Z
MNTFELTILGTSSALPTFERYHTAQVLNVRERFFLIDCGEGAQNQMRKYGVKFSRINHILISHLHGDHYFGLVGLLTSYALLGRKTDLHIYSHSELPNILKPQLETLLNDIEFNLIWHPLNFKRQQTVFSDDALTVKSFPLKHRIPCCGFIFEEKINELNIKKSAIEKYKVPLNYIHRIKKGEDYPLSDNTVIPNSELTLPGLIPRKYAFCTDTLFIPDLKKILQGVDILYHEATFDKTMAHRAGETYHSTAEQAALLAKLSNAGRLLIGHFSTRYKSVSFLEEEARKVFENTHLASEGQKISVVQKRYKDN